MRRRSLTTNRLDKHIDAMEMSAIRQRSYKTRADGIESAALERESSGSKVDYRR
jgi:hypothetical protein